MSEPTPAHLDALARALHRADCCDSHAAMPSRWRPMARAILTTAHQIGGCL